MIVRIDGRGGRSHGLQQQVAMAVVQVIAVSPKVFLSYQSLGKTSAKSLSNAACRDVIGINVIIRVGMERRRLQESDVVWR